MQIHPCSILWFLVFVQQLEKELQKKSFETNQLLKKVLWTPFAQFEKEFFQKLKLVELLQFLISDAENRGESNCIPDN